MKLLLPVICALALATSAFATGTHVKRAKPLSISQGQEVKLEEFLVPGKVTLFIFTSEYCPPCRAYAEPLLLLHEQRTNVAVVKVDINRSEVHQIDWQSPVAKEFDLHSIPHFRIFGPDGKMIADDNDDSRAARAMVDQWIASLK
jgi:thiol-disulfide isomerase/thioredoxin